MTSRDLIRGGVEAALAFVPTAWKGAWAAIAAAGLGLGFALASGALEPRAPWRLPALAACLAILTVVEGALYRLALGREKPGPGGLQWGRLEWRLAGVLLLSVTFLFVLGLLAFVVLLAFAFGMASAGHGFVLASPMTWSKGVDGRARIAMAVVGAFAFLGLSWAALRLSLAPAATAALGRIQVLASWPRTRGVLVPILVGRGLIALVALGGAGIGLAATAHAGASPPPMRWLGAAVAGLLVTGAFMPLSAGFMSYLYETQPA